MISERTLRQWRRDALNLTDISDTDRPLAAILTDQVIEQKQRILRLTQELMDLHLMRKG